MSIIPRLWFRVVGAIALLTASTPAAAMLPKDYFEFHCEIAAAGTFARRFPESLRLNIIHALRSADRDADLHRIGIPVVELLGENWYDLRGLVVNAGELPPAILLSRLCLDYAHLDGIDISGSDLSGVLLRGSRISHSVLSQVVMDDAHLECADLYTCDLRGASLRAVQFGSSETTVRDCNLDGAILYRARGVVRLSGGTARSARFQDADLAGSQFTQAVLDGSDYTDANLRGVDFFASTLNGANFTDAILTEARLENAQLGAHPRFVRTAIGRAYLGDATLASIDVGYLRWPEGDYLLGEERRADMLTNDTSTGLERSREYAKAEVIYRALADRYRQMGYLTEYRGLKYRALEARRKFLSATHTASFERVWLHAYKLWSAYGTSMIRLTANTAVITLIFAAAYLIAFARGSKWFEWQSLGELKMGVGAPMEHTLTGPDTPEKWFKAAIDPKSKTVTLMKLTVEAIFCSIDSLLTAGEVLKLQEIVRLARAREKILVPVGVGKRLVAAEAFLGIVIAASLTAQAINSIIT